MPRGGFRPGATGGARAGAGRPKGSEKPDAGTSGKRFKTALEFALHVINDPSASMDAKVRLAVAAMPFQHAKLEAVAPPGKKDRQMDAATNAGVGKFAAPAPPKLIVNN